MSLQLNYTRAAQKAIAKARSASGGAGAVDYAAFKAKYWRNYQDAPHQQAIERKLEQVARYLLTGGAEGIGRLMIFMPPRHGKTQNVKIGRAHV